MAGRRSGANPVLSGVLERPTPHDSPVAIDRVGLEALLADPADVEPLPAVRGRGASPGEQQVGDGCTARRIQGPDHLPARRPVRANPRPGPPA